MKKIYLSILLLLLTSCASPTPEQTNTRAGDISTHSWASLSTQPETPVASRQGQQNSLSPDIEFSHCESASSYDTHEAYHSRGEVQVLLEKLKSIKYSEEFPNSNFNNIWEYCVSPERNQYIFWAHNDYKSYSIHLFHYNTQDDILTEVEPNNYFTSDYYGSIVNNSFAIGIRNYGDIILEQYLTSYRDSKKDLFWFGLRQGNTIPFANYGSSITGLQESAPGVFSDIYQFFSQQTRDYCQSGLTPEWKLSVCFVDIFYDYDFVANTISESRVCSYYIDDDGAIQTLEKCFDISAQHKWYKLVSKSKWLDFYQDSTGDISVLELDLTTAQVSFGWVNTKFDADVWFVSEQDARAITQTSTENINFDINYYTPDISLNRFYKDTASDITQKLKYDMRAFNISAVVNGQFFTKLGDEKTGVSFPIKSNGEIIATHVDNDIPKRTLVIDTQGQAKILEWYQSEYLNDPKYSELIVAFTPEVRARENAKIGRTYIWLLDANTMVFFIARNKNQDQMDSILAVFGIKPENIIMMDGGPSSQFAYYENQWPGSKFEQYYWEWEVPHYFVIYK